MKKKKAPKKSYYIKKLDQVFSLYIRNLHAKDGRVACYTCGKVGEIKEMQNGHYISRSFMSGRWEPQNCRPQCVGCNVFKNGNYTEFAARLVREGGPDELERLNSLKKILVRYSIEDLKRKIAQYTQKI